MVFPSLMEQCLSNFLIKKPDIIRSVRFFKSLTFIFLYMEINDEVDLDYNVYFADSFV